MKILIVHTRYLQAGGEDVAVAAEADLLRSRGHDVELLESSNSALQTMSSVRAAATTVWNRRARGSVAQAMQRWQPDVVHVHNTFPLLSPSVYYAGQRNGVALVQTLHNYRLVCPGATLMRADRPCADCVGKMPWRAVVHRCYRDSAAASFATSAMLQTHRVLGTWERMVDLYIALTPGNRDVFIRGGLRPDRIAVKPNFIDPDPGQGAHQADHFLYAGRLTRAKGVLLMLEAWAMMPDAPKLRVLGDGPLSDAVRTFAARNPQVEYLGSVSRQQVIREMKRAKALIAPALSYENFPFATCEAMATGLPVIAADLPNVRDIVDDGRAGLLFRSGDAAHLRDVVLQANQNREQLNEAGHAARALFLRNYTAEANYHLLLQAYGTAIEFANGRRHEQRI